MPLYMFECSVYLCYDSDISCICNNGADINIIDYFACVAVVVSRKKRSAPSNETTAANSILETPYLFRLSTITCFSWDGQVQDWRSTTCKVLLAHLFAYLLTYTFARTLTHIAIRLYITHHKNQYVSNVHLFSSSVQ